MASQGLTASLQALGPCLTFYPKLARAIGLKESILLCQLIYWTPRSKREGGWVYKSAEEFEMETGLSYKEQRRVREVLRARGLIEERNAKEEHRLYFRVIPDAIDRAFGEHLPVGHMPEGKEAPAQREGGTCPKGSSLIGTENTQEITQFSRPEGERHSDEPRMQLEDSEPEGRSESSGNLFGDADGDVPSRPIKADPRHTPFRAALGEYWRSKNPLTEMPWGGSEAKALAQLLRDAPNMTLEVFVGCLRGRFKSNVNHGDRPRMWIGSLTSYLQPIDRYKIPIGENGHGTNRESVTKQRVDGNLAAIARAAERLGMRRTSDPGGANGSALSGPGPWSEPGGLHPGFQGARVEVLPPEGARRAGHAEDRAGAEVLPEAG